MAIRVLLVDDVLEVRRLVRTALRFRGQFSVVGEAADGTTAIQLTEQLRPDIVVLDIGLPDLAGREVLTGLRRALPTVKVVVFSGTEPEDSAGIAEQVEGYALKDSELDYLVELLEKIGRERTGQSAVRLPADLSSAREARDFTRSVLDQWHAPDVLDDALLVVSEMVTNAVTHAASSCELRISVSPEAVRVEVVDRGAGTPDPMPPSATRIGGRGLHLIDALTAAWGVEPEDGGGKTVWAELLRAR
ncbi:MAG TPA: ATP-binding protein [Jatrophihabitans sp.]|nr:ATP-binding protein [Jatrophihabitans sp.]